MLRPMPIEPVPHEPARVARATLPTWNRNRRLADARETLFTDAAFPTLCPTHGQPTLPPRRLALVEPGTIIISSATYRLVQRRLQCQALGTHSLGSVSQPVVVYRVLKEQKDQYELTPLVARQ